jgi:methanogenic corrinoid protein MtbC1
MGPEENSLASQPGPEGGADARFAAFDRDCSAGLAQAQGPVADLLRLALRHDVDGAARLCQALRQEGVPVRTLLDELIPRVARRLGALWQQDDCDFAQVTMASQVLHDVVSRMRGALQLHAADHPRAGAPTVLLCAVPHCQHTLGVTIVSEFFHADGWDVWTAPDKTLLGLAQLLERQCFDLIALSFGAGRDLPMLQATIAAVRATAVNRSTPVIVGGPGVLTDEALALDAAVDGIALDAGQALQLARRLLHEGGRPVEEDRHCASG